MSRLVLVSNRVPSATCPANAGGLAVALKAALEASGGLWLGWSGRVSERPEAAPKLSDGASFALATLDLSRREFRGYYEACANRALWPLFHGLLDYCRPDAEAHVTYRAVNLRFARAWRPLLNDGDTVWVHDYHLFPLGRELRRLGLAGPMGFFLHIPFPPAETLAVLPWHRDLLADLCAYDLVGFQTAGCADNFRRAAARHLGAGRCGDGALRVGGRLVEVGVFPVGIDTRAFTAMAEAPEVRRRAARLRRRRRQCDWICGVERLDYTKGIAERFGAFDALLQAAPALKGRVSLIQVAAPSRPSLPEYREMAGRLEALAGRINGHHGSGDWRPIRYLNKAYSQRQLAALYRVSRVALVTPLRDGMNLVAKEYVAAQEPEDPGVLVLSRFAGAARQLSHAILVDPYDEAAVARSLRAALAMPLAERTARWQAMYDDLERDDVHRWHSSFVARLAGRKAVAAERKVA